MAMGFVTIRTSSGQIRGREGYAFLGIPYGRAERFRPAEGLCWDDTLDATRYRSRSAQPNALGKWPAGLPFSLVGSEDCLNLNVWTPTLDPAARLPVCVYVHGGAFQVGGNDDPGRAGDRFMGESPMVFISVNYRLGVLGSLYLGEALGEAYADSGNLAELDVLLALRWVRENAAVFGGDPDRICLLGISAGAKLIGALMTMPGAEGLFSRVILESGARQAFRDKHTAAAVTQRFLCSAGIGDARELLTMDTEQILRAQAHFCDCHGSTAFFGPVPDGRRFDPDADAGSWRGEALVGSGRCELIRLARDPAFLEDPGRVLAELFGDRAGEVREVIAAAGADWTRGLSDAMYRDASDRLASRLSRGGSRVWSYSFDFPTAHHGMGFHFIMKQWDAPYCQVPTAEREAARALSETMNTAVRAFITGGDPDPEGQLGWQPLSPAGEGEKMVFDKSLGKCPFRGDSLRFPGEYTYRLE